MKIVIQLFCLILFLAFSGMSIAQTCSDGIQNGTETGIDCGGTCVPCSTPCSITLVAEVPPVQGGCCTYILEMNDSFGDGWNGASISIVVAGVTYGPYSATGSGTDVNIPVCDGETVQINYLASGSWPSECSYILLDGGGNPVYQAGPNPTVANNVFNGTGQCFNPGVLDCTGGNVVLTAEGQGASVLALDNDFDFGNAGSGWTSNVTASFNNPCNPSVDGGTYMWMGSSAQHPRIIQTVPLDLSCGGDVCFYLDFATQGDASPCEGIDLADEGVYLEYSTNGGATWNTMEYFGPAGVGNITNDDGTNPQMTSWNQYCYQIPLAAETPNTIIHWAQTGSSGATTDHWGIDNVTISSVADCTPYWYDYSYLPPSSDNPIQTENVTATTTYNVTYTNGNDACSTSVTVNLPPCPCPVATLSGGGSYCVGQPIPDVVFAVTGGNYPITLTYAIDGAIQTPLIFSAADTTFENPIEGNYTIVAVTDPSLCVGTFSGTANIAANPAPIFTSFTGGNTYCAGNPVDNLIVNASGSGPLTIAYTLSGVAQTPVSGNSPISLGNTPGVYVLTLLTDSGCSSPINATQSIVINPIPTATAGTSSPVVCEGETILLTANTVSGTYNWTGPNNFSSTIEDPQILSSTSAATGTYSLTITANGCTSPASTVNVLVNTIPVFNSFTGGNTYCAGDVINNLQVNASGTGTLTVTYTLDGVSQTPVSGSSPISLGNSPGVYALTLLSDIGCSAALNANQTIVVNPIPIATAGTSTPVICAGETILLTGNTATGFYSWTGPNNYSSTNEDPQILTATIAATGTYSLIITANGCVSPPSTVNVLVNPVPVVTTNANLTICSGTPVTLSGQGATSYAWSGGVIDNVTFTPNATTTYVVTGTTNGCSSSATVIVTVLPLPIALGTPSISSGYAPLPVTFTNNSSNATSYLWEFGNGSSVPTNSMNSVNTTFSTPGTYFIVLTASNGICDSTWSDSVVVISYPEMIINVPNVFSPNNDNANELYFIDVINGESFEAFILNRWGNVVFTMDKLNQGWDGKINGNPAAEGVYFVKYIAKGLDNMTKEGHTYFHLVR
jgi:gliding motility-associated-like protein